MRRVALPAIGPSKQTMPPHAGPPVGLDVRATRREPHRATRHPKQPKWKLPLRAPAENRAKATGRNGRFPSRAFTASWRPCIQTTREGRHRRHGHRSDRPCRPVQRVLPKRIRGDIRTRRTSPERPNRPASRAFDATWLSRNANETPSSLIRDPAGPKHPTWRGWRNPLPVPRRVAAMKKKERPPKDDRPKEKRFRHGGRKGRRAARRREEAKRP